MTLQLAKACIASLAIGYTVGNLLSYVIPMPAGRLDRFVTISTIGMAGAVVSFLVQK